MHEIVTVQLGSQANYLASHFWNAQVQPPKTFYFLSVSILMPCV